ncbi:3-oxoacid CoA-transferase subunit B [Streptococcus pluranimalium]|uniref:3-oxoacid CoA-transferase subunit B n=1 Tax=Streptococcus pluranimalium TaxID=82348 RepID=UPI003139A2C7
MNAKEIIARRVALEFRDGDVINLGFGIPNASADFIPEGVNVILQAENGALRFGETPTKDNYNPNLANSGGAPITLLPGASTFDIQTSFSIIRGGHVDATVLGALEVSQDASIANWIIPDKFAPGMGGAMDLLVGAKRVIAAIQHVDKYGESKVLKECRLPLSAKGVVSRVITDLAVLDFQDGKYLLREVAPGVTVEEVIEKTAGEVIVPDDIITMPILVS